MVKSDAYEVIDLKLPDWNLIEPFLIRKGIQQAATLSAHLKQLLATPQHLRVFLDRFQATGQVDFFGSYHGMLDDFWGLAVTSVDDAKLVAELTNYLVANEQLWAPLVKFNSDSSRLRHLESKGLLTIEQGRVGFRHQTLFDHAKARLFVLDEVSLRDHVIERQSAMFVRPTVWAVLRYLRDVDRSKYREELEALFASNLRLHIWYLLYEMLGQVAAPEEFEVVLLAQHLRKDESRTRVLISITGNAGWFALLKRTHFPVLMSLGETAQWPMLSVICAAWGFDREGCLALIEMYWLPTEAKDELTWRALNALGKWDERSLDFVLTLIRRATSPRLFWAESIASVISADKPDLAPIVFINAISRQLAFRSEDEHSSPLSTYNEWYDIPAIAEAAPIVFLEQGWNWLVAACEEYHSFRPSSVVYEYSGYCMQLDDREMRVDAPIITAFLAAIEMAGRNHPDEFMTITRAYFKTL